MASSTKDIYIDGLRNAHALEAEAAQLLQRQVERLENYPAMAARIREHIEESLSQQKRLEQILERLGTSSSTLKDIGASVMGNLAALAHVPAGDEVLKNTFANYAFEHFEIAAYRALIEMAQAAGDQAAVEPLQQTLREEEKMAQWIGDHLPETVKTYISRESSGQKAGI